MEFRLFDSRILLALFLFSGSAGQVLAQNSFVVAWKEQTARVDGSTVTYVTGVNRIISRGEAGSFLGTINDWKSGSPPSNIETYLEGIRDQWRGQGRFSFWWADNARTFVIVRVNLKPLPGFGDDTAGIESFGVLTTNSNHGNLTLDDRLDLALSEAVFRLPARLEKCGISDKVWGRLVADAEKKKWAEGVPFELVAVYDSSVDDAEVWKRAHELLNQRRAKVRQVPFMLGKVREMAKSHAEGKKDHTWSTAKFYREEDDFPIARFWQAWQRIEANDYGPETIELVEKAERALQKSSEKGPELPLLVTVHKSADARYGSAYTGEELLESLRRYNEAYVNYLRGIVEENLANQSQDAAEAKAHRNKASAAFKRWFEACRYGEYALNDPMMMRSAGIALHNGTRGYPLDEQAAMEMFEAAAALGSVDALNWLGTIYDFLGGQYTNPAKAVDYYEKASAKGNTFAKYNLGMMHFFGAGGLPQDREKGYSLYLDGLGRKNLTDKEIHDQLFGGDQARQAPLFEKHLRLVSVPFVEARSPQGDTLTVTGVSGHYPVSLVAAPGEEPLDGRDLQFKVEYKTASGGLARLEVMLDWSGISTEPGAKLFVRPMTKVEGTGEETVWIGSASPARYIGQVKINLLHPTQQKVLVSADVPVVARWDKRVSKPVKAPAKISLSKETKQKLEQRFKEGINKSDAGDDAGALAIFDELLRQNPDDANFRAASGYTKRRLNDLTGAAADLTEAIRLDPSNAGAFETRALVRLGKNDLNGSLSDLESAAKLAPRDMGILSIRGEVRAALGKLELALEDFNRVIDEDPKDVVTLFLRGQLQDRRENTSAALADYSRVLQLDPKNVGALHNRAVIKFYRQDFGGAMEDELKARELAPKAALVASWIGYIHFAQSDYAAAAIALTQGADLQSDGSNAYQLILRHFTLQRLGQPDNRLATSLGRWKDDPWPQALAKFAVGQATEDELEKLSAAPADEKARKERQCEMHFYIGLARLQAGDKSTARMRFQLALATGIKNFTESVYSAAELKRL